MPTVAVVLDHPLAQEVSAWAEMEAGWHVVSVGGRPAPQLVLADAVLPGWPTVVLVDGPAETEQVHAALQAGAVDVIAWPAQRERLVHVAAGATAARPGAGAPAGPRVLVVAGAGGGAGTSTVALAAAGLLAWSGRRVLVVGGDDLLALAGMAPWRGPGVRELAQLEPTAAAAEAGALGRPVRGVPRLAVLGSDCRDGAGDGAAAHAALLAAPAELVSGWPVDVVVADGGTSPSPAQLVVARPDRSLRSAGSAPVAVTGTGLLGRSGVRRALGREPACWLPQSARVARAGLAGRVPSGLPGRWLLQLRPALGRVLAGVPR